MAQQNVCGFNKFGYCKYKEACWKIHNDKICEKPTCEIRKCNSRHPKNCKFLRGYGYCKYGEWCKFKHKVIEKKDDEEMKNKVHNLEKLVVKKEDIEKILSEKIEDLKDIIAKEFVERIKNVEKLIKEKDDIIKALEKRINKMSKINEKNTTEKSFQCSECDFKTDSKPGLKIHQKRKHTCLLNENYPTTCEFCNTEINNIKEMKNHMLLHSYKKVSFQCQDCEFVGENKSTMEVHNGKHHANEKECGLCEFNTVNTENLEIHLSTCEMYLCYESVM